MSGPHRVVALVAGSSFPPIPVPESQRILALSRHLPSHGWTPVVLTVPSNFLPPPWLDPSSLEDVPPDLEIHRIAPALGRSTARPRVRPGSRLVKFARDIERVWHDRLVLRLRTDVLVPDSFASWAPAARARLRSLITSRRVDAVLTTSAPSSIHLVGPAARAAGVPWVADLQAPWEAGPRRFGVVRDLASRVLAARTLRRASHVTAITDGIAEIVEGIAGVPRARITVVPNGLDLDMVPTADRYPSREPVTFLYTGRLVPGRDPTPFLDAVERVVRRSPALLGRFEIRFVGHVHRDLATGLGPAVRRPWIRAFPWLPRDETLRMQREADVLVLVPGAFEVTGAARRYRISMPGKALEYLQAGRPILALSSIEGDAERLLRATGSGVVVPLDDGPAIERAVEEILVHGRLPPRPDPRRLARYDWRNVVRELAGVLDSATRAVPARVGPDPASASRHTS